MGSYDMCNNECLLHEIIDTLSPCCNLPLRSLSHYITKTVLSKPFCGQKGLLSTDLMLYTCKNTDIVGDLQELF